MVNNDIKFTHILNMRSSVTCNKVCQLNSSSGWLILTI